MRDKGGPSVISLSKNTMDSDYFLGLNQTPVSQSDVILLPLPFEGTVSYGKGTALGPDAVISSSSQIELWDEELLFDLESLKYHTVDPVVPHPEDRPETYLHRVMEIALDLRQQSHQNSPLILGIGGEHSLTPALVMSAVSHANDLSDVTVIQIDAHADLRNEYEGTSCSHACAMRRLVEKQASLIAIGIRSFEREEFEFSMDSPFVTIFTAQQLAQNPAVGEALRTHLQELTGHVYLTIDVDGLECALCPSTGTPQPGGLPWWNVLQYLRTLLWENPNVQMLGADIVETVPHSHSKINEFTAAKLLTKIIAYAKAK